MSRRTQSTIPALAAALVGVSVAVLWFVVRSPINLTGDTIALIGGTHAGLGCLGDGMLTNCGIQVTPYPLLQFLPASAFIGLGLGDGDVQKALSVLNACAFVAMLGLGWGTLQRLGHPALAAALALALLASPLPWYAWSTFGESLGACACLAFVAAALWRAPPVALVVLLVLAGQSKETALPFLALLGAGALVWSPIEGRPLRSAHWIAFGVGAGLSLVLTGAFNEFRFGQLTNAVYSEPAERTPTVGLKARFVLSLWLAPNGGLGIFWPVSAVAFFIMLAVAAVRVRRWREHLRPVGAGAVLLACLVAMTYGYANWFAPFGWLAWGPRLMLLLVPALLLFGLATLAPELRALAAAAGRWATAARVAVGALALGTVLAQIGVLFHTSAMADLFDPDAECPRSVSVAAEPSAYYHCIIHWAWYRHWVLPDAVGGVVASFSSVLMIIVWLTAAVVAALAVVIGGADRADATVPAG